MESSNEKKLENDRSGEFFRKIVELVNNLPSVPRTIMDLRVAVSDPSTDYTRLVNILDKDTDLCDDLLKFANSAYYGVEHRVESVTEAVRYFGMTNLVELVAASFSERVINRTFHDLSDLGSYFRHSKDISRACGMLASAMNINRREQELYVMAGLLHDIGKLVIALATNRTSAPLGGTAWDKLNSIIDEEKAFSGTDHATVGAEVIKRWGFPSKLVESVFRHHTPAQKTEIFSTPGAILHLAHYVAMPNLPHGRLKNALPDLGFEKLGLAISTLYDTRVAFMANPS